jgi:cytoskeletal protein RodZ
MSVVHIYQFCRAFDNVRYSEVYGCYVSGGYAFEKIARASHEVPPEIREAVINDYFKLNDNYPPETGDFALIAREIDNKYSVLAVANRQLDDGGRPTIGYKYFWLEKSSSDVDGIGTLIYWWSNHKKPKFDMAELVEKSPPERLYYQEIQKRNFLEILKYVQKLNEIPEITVVKKELWQQAYPAYIELHYLALGLSDRATRLNAWAWNVHKIAYPERFLAIFYATQEDIPKNISKRQLPSPQKDNSNTSVSTPTKENTTQTVPVQKIKKCLKDIAKIFADTDELDSKKTEELFEYLAKYPNENWSDFIDKTTLQAIPDKCTLIYKAEIYLLLPKEKSSFLIEILNSTNFGNSSGKSTSNSIAIEFHTQLLNASYKYQNQQVIHRLVSSIYTGISYLLNHLMADDNGSNQIEFLLTQSQSIWSKTFLTYAELVKKRIFPEKETEKETIVEESLETFCQEILTILQEPKNITLEKRNQYKKLVSTFININHYPLAGTFCYISDRFIPQDILLIDNEIYRKIQNIQLSSQDKSNSNNEHKNSEAIDNKSENNRSQKKQKLPGKTTTPKRPKRRREINNRIWFILFGIFLVIVVVFVTAIIILIISRNPPPNNNNQDQSHIQNIRKNEKENNSPVNNLENPSANSTTLSTSNTSSGCATDLLSNLEVFKACNETDKDELEVELRNSYKLLTIENAKLLRQYYLDSTEKKPFQDRKSKIQECYINNSSHQSFNTCLKDIMRKYK